MKRNLLQLHGQIQQVVATQMVQDLVSGLLHDCGSRIIILVHAVAEAHEPHALFLILHPVHEVGSITTICGNFLQHLQHRLVRPTMQRARQRINATSNGHEHIRLGGSNHAHRRRRTVLLMVGVQNKQLVQGFRHHRIHLVRLGGIAEHHAQEILPSIERVIGIHVRCTLRRPVSIGGEHRHLR